MRQRDAFGRFYRCHQGCRRSLRVEDENTPGIGAPVGFVARAQRRAARVVDPEAGIGEARHPHDEGDRGAGNDVQRLRSGAALGRLMPMRMKAQTMSSYTPQGTAGFRVGFTTTRGNAVQLTVNEAHPEPSFTGSQQLLDNESFRNSLTAYGTHEQQFRHARASERRESYRAAAAKALRRAIQIADLIERLGTATHIGWCSGCFSMGLHGRVDARFGTLSTYLCVQCGAPTTPCAIPGCSNMANRGIRAVSAPRYCAEHRHDIPSFLRMTDRLPSLESYERWLAYDKRNARRVTQITSAVVIAGACITPFAFAAAPALGGALGSATGLSGAAATSHGLAMLGGGSLAAGGSGMAGGVVVATAIGSGLGGVLGGVTAAAYVQEDRSFRIELLRRGSGSPVLVTNGFLTEGQPGWDQWRRMIDARYPDASVYQVHWGSKELRALSAFVGGHGVRHLTRTGLGKLAAKAAEVGPKRLTPYAVPLILGDLVKNPWSVAVHRAEMTGAVLADLIARTECDRFVLIGHSLGARVMVCAAQILGTRRGSPKVEAIHLLGAAVSRPKTGDWRLLSDAVVEGVWNYYSRNDRVLSRLYRAAQFNSQAVGSVGFGSKFVNLVDKDVSKIVLNHHGYFDSVTLARPGRVARG